MKHCSGHHQGSLSGEEFDWTEEHKGHLNESAPIKTVLGRLHFPMIYGANIVTKK